ncbi:MAG: hypothetical protein ACOYXC_04075 [Candidatus Rifleibacteriota bacterium]
MAHNQVRPVFAWDQLRCEGAEGQKKNSSSVCVAMISTIETIVDATSGNFEMLEGL